MEQIKQIKQYADILRLTQLRNKAEQVIHQAQIDKPSYLELICSVLKAEVLQRQKNNYPRFVIRLTKTYWQFGKR